MRAGTANIADRRMLRDGNSGAGKGDKPRPVSPNKYYNSKLWDVMGPQSRGMLSATQPMNNKFEGDEV